MPRFLIVNLITREKAEIDADFASDALNQLGWPAGSCRVELKPAEEMSPLRTRGLGDEDTSSEKRRLLVLMVLLGALVGGLSGLGSDIAVVGAIFGAFIGGALSIILWGLLGSDAVSVVNTILVIALAAAAIGWVIQMVYTSMHL